VEGPRLVVAGHIISASAGHGDLCGLYASHWDLPVSAVADGTLEIRRLVRREHAYLIDEEAIGMATRAGPYIVPTMQMTQEDLGELRADTLPDQAVWKFRRDSRRILDAQRLVASSDAKVALGTGCGMFPFSHWESILGGTRTLRSTCPSPDWARSSASGCWESLATTPAATATARPAANTPPPARSPGLREEEGRRPVRAQRLARRRAQRPGVHRAERLARRPRLLRPAARQRDRT